MTTFPDEYAAAVKYGRPDAETLNAFHGKMREDPRAGLPHLVFADYLEDRGNPGVAEIIRRAAGREPLAERLFYKGEAPPFQPLEVRANRTLRPATPGRHPPFDYLKTYLVVQHMAVNTKSRRRRGAAFLHTINVPAEEAHRILSLMPPSWDVDLARQSIEEEFPHLVKPDREKP